ncbi:hypothetical protein GQ53DRAFT_464999 [Thozetella sp. PMI_491]|nr:hypothetical protein GQ53DRAFT_464999 [Thozetella sp. PMI_491]
MGNGPPLSFDDSLGTLSSFTPSATCLERITSLPDPRAGQGVGRDRTYFVGMIGNNVDKTCYPPGYQTDVFYPTGVCPSGWTSACAPTYTVAINNSAVTLSMFPTGFPAAQCCPSGFGCYDAFFCSSAAPPTQVTALLVSPTTTTAAITIDSGDPVWAKPIFVKLGSVPDFSITSTTRTLTTATDASVTAPLQSSASECAGTCPTSAPGALSTDTKIALAAVIPVTVFALIAGGLWFFCARRRPAPKEQANSGTYLGELRSEDRSTMAYSSPAGYSPAGYHPGSDYPPAAAYPPAGTYTPVELDSRRDLAEIMDSDVPKHSYQRPA